MNVSKKLTWNNALTLVLVIACAALLIGVLWSSGRRTAPFATEPEFVVGTTRPAGLNLEEDFQADETLLSTRIPLSIFHSGQSLQEALRAAADAAHSRLQVDWKPLDQVGLRHDAKLGSAWAVPPEAGDIPLRTALRWILNDVTGGTSSVDFTIDNGAILVTSGDELQKHTVSVVYNIRDLIEIAGADKRHVPTQETVDDLTMVVRDTVARETWTENGGTIGSLREMMGLLIVTQTRANHLQLAQLLMALRRTARAGPRISAGVEPMPNSMPTPIPSELERKISTLQIHDQATCETAIESLVSAAGVAIRIDWESFQPLNIGWPTPVHVPSALSNVSIAEAIHRILAPDEDIGVLSFRVHDGTVAVAFDRTTEVYNVRDLESPMPSSGAANNNGPIEDDLELIVTSTIAPKSWIVAGGTIGYVRHISGGLLVVTQTRPAHAKIIELLRKLREAKAAQRNK